jgi:acyl carrier protein
METAEKILDEILTLAAAHFKVPREKLSPDEDFFKALGIDSLQTLDLLTKLKTTFASSCRTTNCRGSPTSALWQARFRRGCELQLLMFYC